jgi:hypothetical protein
MKRATLILLTITYLFSSLGVSAKSMYCMGVLRQTTISYSVTTTTTTTTHTKAECKMANRMKNCCKTKKQLLKVSDKHVYSGAMEVLAKLFPVLFNLTQNDEPVCARVISQQQSYYTHAPPPVPGTPVYVLNCNFRI